MFGNFSIDKLTDSISNVALKTQENLTTAISTVSENVENYINDPNTKLSIKARTRYVQEQLGTIDDDISKLPVQYLDLERKTDSMEKILKRMLTVTRTFETEGYDYPPNLSESLTDWWSNSNEDETGGSTNDSFLPRSFAQALSKASADSTHVVNNVKKQIKESNAKLADAQEPDAANEEEDEEDEDLANLAKILDSMAKCYKNIDEGKAEMDNMIVNEFNKKLETLINTEFKDVNKLRRDVENSRLKFDTMRYEAKLRELKAQPVATKTEESKPEEKKEETTTEISQEEKKDVKEGSKTQETSNSIETNDEDDKLLEHLEDEFVSNTTAAVEKMEDITDSTKLLNLIKLFQNFQLVYYRQCVQEIENSLKTLSELEN